MNASWSIFCVVSGELAVMSLSCLSTLSSRSYAAEMLETRFFDGSFFSSSSKVHHSLSLIDSRLMALRSILA
jgi:hypothetical protein